MTRNADGDDNVQDCITDARPENDAAGDTAGDAAPEAPASPAALGPAAPPVAAIAPEASAAPAPGAVLPGNLAEITAQLRHDAAEIAEIAAQAGRLGITIDAAKALRDAITPEALRRLVLDRASAAADARDIVAAPPSPVLPQSRESPIVAAAKRAATAGGRG